MNVLDYARLNSSTGRRPAPVTQSAIAPPWDQSDSGGIVHTTQPPELVIPSNPSNWFLRADFNGVTLDASAWPDSYFQNLSILGANSTPWQMIMTPMLVLYPRPLQDAVLTAHAQRSYSHFIIAPDGWNLSANGFQFTPASLVQWAQYIASWGFDIILWQSDPTGPDPLSQALHNSGLLDWFIPGEEVDSKVTSEQYDQVLQNSLSFGVPLGAHFTSNYPSGFPRDTFLTDWSPYNGKVHLMWQADQHDSAGTQGARLYYARQRVNLGLIGDGDYSNPAPDCRVYAFETMATAQLYGQCDENYGCLRSLELMYTTRLNDGIAPMAGFGNGCRLADGSPM